MIVRKYITNVCDDGKPSNSSRTSLFPVHACHSGSLSITLDYIHRDIQNRKSKLEQRNKKKKKAIQKVCPQRKRVLKTNHGDSSATPTKTTETNDINDSHATLELPRSSALSKTGG